MSLYNTNALFTTGMVANGFPHRMEDHPKRRSVFLDVTPTRSPYIRPAYNQVQPTKPMIDTLMNQNIAQDVVYENIKPVLTVLRLMGVLPLSRPAIGVSQFVGTSPAMMYSALIYFSLIAGVLYISLHGVQTVKSAEGKFEEAVIGYLFTVYLFPMTVIPILWYETRKIANLLNEWTNFELIYLRLSGRPLPLTLRRKALVIAVAIPAMSTTSVLITHVTMVHFQLTQILPYIFLETLTYMLGGYWYLLCETLSDSANVLAEDFQLALRNIGPAGKVAEYRALWLRLSKLGSDTGIANCYTFTFLNLYLFFIITLSVYGLLSQISEGFGIKDIGLTVTACCSIGLLFVICDEAHYASNNVRTNFQKKLLMVELSWMNTDAQTELNMFLRATEMNPSQISLGGFFNVNRNLFKALLTTMVTYLVVLLQFQISIPEEGAAPANGTLAPMQPVGNGTLIPTTPALLATTLKLKA